MFVARTHAEGEADDFLQDLYLKLAGVGEIEIGSVDGYLYRLAMNLLIDRQRRRSSAIRRDAAWRQASTKTLGGVDVAAEDGPEEVMLAKTQYELVRRELDKLPPRTQRIFEMHKGEDVPYAQIALRLGISKSAVEKHMMRALKHLLEALRS
jgi:RNA polymerase sigma-70 factor (ECF subfamily)